VSRKKLVSFKFTDVDGPPDEQWLWFTAALLRSDAWRYRSFHLARLLDFLHVEHLRHGRQRNGHLLAPYDQLAKFGLYGKYAGPAIKEGETRGLIEVIRRGRAASLYRVCYFPSATIADDGVVTFHAPTDEWKHYVEPRGRRNGAAKNGLAEGQSSLIQRDNRPYKQNGNPRISAISIAVNRDNCPVAPTDQTSLPSNRLSVEAACIVPALLRLLSSPTGQWH
jgi:hypothetical protein